MNFAFIKVPIFFDNFAVCALFAFNGKIVFMPRVVFESKKMLL